VLTYRGRRVTAADIERIRELVAGKPGASRRALSQELARAWGWVQPNGRPSDMVCRSLMPALHRAGLIELPPVRYTPPNPLARRARPVVVEVDSTPLGSDLAGLGPLTFRQVRRTDEEPLFNGLIEAHHYLGYVQPVGEHLKYIVYAGARPVACFAWSSAPRHLGPRDRYIGWSPETPASQRAVHSVQQPVPDPAVGARAASRVTSAWANGSDAIFGLGPRVRAPGPFSGDIRGPGTIPGHVLSSVQLGPPGPDDGTREGRHDASAKSVVQRCAGLSADEAFPRVTIGCSMTKKIRKKVKSEAGGVRKPRHLDVDLQSTTRPPQP